MYISVICPKNLQIANKLENKVDVHNRFYSLLMLDFQKQKNITKIIEEKKSGLYLS